MRAGAHHRDPIAPRRVVGIEDRSKRCVTAPGSAQEEDAATIGSSHDQPEVLQRQQHRGRGARTDRGAPPEAEERRRPSSAGMTSSAHSRSRPAEEDARERGADDEHQQARVGHVVAERAARPVRQVVVAEERVLDDADRGAGRADRHDDGDERLAARSRREAVDERNDQEEHELLGVDEADARLGRRTPPTPA